MTNKELILLGMALSALMELKEYDKVKEIIDKMANDVLTNEKDK